MVVGLLKTFEWLTWITALISSREPRNVTRWRDGPDTETRRLLRYRSRLNLSTVKFTLDKESEWVAVPTKKAEPWRGEGVRVLRTGGEGEGGDGECDQQEDHWQQQQITSQIILLSSKTFSFNPNDNKMKFTRSLHFAP